MNVICVHKLLCRGIFIAIEIFILELHGYTHTWKNQRHKLKIAADAFVKKEEFAVMVNV